MSYRTFKRALGETNLERKCRLLFGACLLVLITSSFWWYGSQTDKLVYERNRYTGGHLVNQALMVAHATVYDNDPFPDPALQSENKELIKELLDLKFTWAFFHPENPAGIGKPRNSKEWNMMTEWGRIGKELSSDEEINERKANTKLWRDRFDDQRDIYRYYQPIFTKEYCVFCHSKKTFDLAEQHLRLISSAWPRLRSEYLRYR